MLWSPSTRNPAALTNVGAAEVTIDDLYQPGGRSGRIAMTSIRSVGEIMVLGDIEWDEGGHATAERRGLSQR